MNSDNFLQFAFNQVLDWMSWTVTQLQRIPTGLGVSLWTFLIAVLITTIVVTAVVNVVTVGGDAYISHSRKKENEARYQRRVDERKK